MRGAARRSKALANARHAAQKCTVLKQGPLFNYINHERAPMATNA
jgi:hypothetical protein